MKKNRMITFALLTLALTFTAPAFCADDETIEKEDVASQSVKDRPEWTQALKDKYKLTDEQITSMKDKGITNPQMAMVAGLAEKSGKTIDEVLKMRTEDKMGWGKIAKSLGVPPGEIGHSVSELRHQVASARHEAKMESKAERHAKKAEKMQQKLERKAERAEAKKNRH